MPRMMLAMAWGELAIVAGVVATGDASPGELLLLGLAAVFKRMSDIDYRDQQK